MVKIRYILTILISLISLFNQINSQVLNPPYINIAEGRKFFATSTCGEGQVDLYCRLVGSNFGYEQAASGKLIKGQFCDTCNASDPTKTHKADYITDGTDRWWQSPPLSRGLDFAQVNLTLDLKQEFHIAYILLKMGNSPRPDVWVLEKSIDFGDNWIPWQYFAPTKEDCVKFFGNKSLEPITRDDSVICETKFSKIVPLENAEITVKLVTDRPGASNFSMSPTLQAWSKATNIRFRFLRPQTTLEDLVEGTRRDKTVTRRYFYSLQDVNIGGRCVCNGHANVCNILDPGTPSILHCQCKHHTCGPQCDTCCVGYEQKKWKPATVEDPFQCEPCNCFGHSEECYYDEKVDLEKKSIDIYGNYSGGGVCKNCKDNTKGNNCNECIDGYFRKANISLSNKNVCTKCECNEDYHTGRCENESGICECKPNFNSPNCDSCSFGYYDYPRCKPCECYVNGTTDAQCEFSKTDNDSENEIADEKTLTQVEPQCSCKENFAGPQCRECAPKFFGFPNCTRCDCEKIGLVDEICDQQTGKCKCQVSFGGFRCEKCDVGYYNYPECKLCSCDITGTSQQICDQEGKCLCKEGYAGEKCDQCAPEYFGYPNCQPCNCFEKGSLYNLCSPKTGKCSCLSNYDGRVCNKCKPGFYNESDSCVACNCDIHGSFGPGCNALGKCNCKENYDGDKCDRCKKDYYNYPLCERCDCNLNGIKDTFNGCNKFSTFERLCDCKERVTGRKCNQCKNLFWKLNKYNPLGCQECQCLVNGTLSGLGTCHSSTGQCNCKQNVMGRVCNDCKDGFYKMEPGNHFGCSACECDSGGSEHPYCLKQSGKCSCKARITGRTCDIPIKSHYFPTLYQLIYEMEDATTPQGTQARYDHNESVFPDFSWKGYANYSDLQKELNLDVQIDQASIYRPVINYINSNNEPINGQLIFTPASQSNSLEKQQVINLQLDPTNLPKKHLPATKVGIQAMLPLKKGLWKMTLKLDKPALVDYLVLLPNEYWGEYTNYEFKLPCTLFQKQEPNNLCKHYAYPIYPKNSTILTGSQSAITANNYNDKGLLKKVFNDDRIQPTVLSEVGQEYKFTPNFDGKHVLVVSYHNFDLDKDASLNEHNLKKLDFKLRQLNGNPEKDENSINEDKNNIKENLINNRTLYEAFMKNFIEHKSSNEKPVTADLTNCIYSFVCKQIVKNQENDIGYFDLSKENEYQLSLKPSENSKNLPAIVDLTFIPLDEWSFDYINGEVICNRNATGHCIPNEFLDYENENKLRFIDRSEEGQPEIKEETYKIDEKNFINLSQSNFLNTNQLTVIASGNVSEPKLYTFVVEYYQPNHAAFDIQSNIITNNGRKDEVLIPSKIPIKYCPNVSGCKTQIVTINNGTLFELTDIFDLAVVFPPEKSIYIKKINVISNENFHQNSLQPQPIQFPHIDFYKDCAQDAFYVNETLYNQYWNQTTNSFIEPEENEKNNVNVSKFCRKTIFGLTVKFNRGALPCNCNQRGSTSYDCAHFGGQCQCKPNVIGRKCSECKTGYYGFPNCRPCNCPSTAYCEPKTGKCVCPPRVTGSNCDTCVALTFGYHHINGCEECKCHGSGVLNNNLQCNTDTGACECKKNIAGRRCNQCVNGFYSFPQCTLCSCDKRGATEQICDSNTGKCYCKSNTVGESCDQCKSDSFHLDESNPEGCSKCWCSGVASRCRSSDYVYIKHIDMLNKMGSRQEYKVIVDKKNNSYALINNDGWTATKLVFITEKLFNEFVMNSISKDNDTLRTNIDSTTILDFNENQVVVDLPENERKEIDFSQDSLSNSNIVYGYYLRLPSSYLGKKLTSYGGNLFYTVKNTLENTYEGVFTGPDVILKGNDLTIIHEILEQPLSPNEDYSVNLTLTEKSFKLMNGSPVPRDKFMMLLMNITNIYVKGVYFKYAKQFSLSNVALDVGSNEPLFKNANSNYAELVEQCFCPKGYTGSSCERCASGYYKTKVGPYLGYCVPCKCHFHSQECDVDTGVCFNCAHNTTGNHCEKCVTGYYGDATRGSSLDCMICPCPLAQESNNFALSCELNSFNINSRAELDLDNSNALTSPLLSSQFKCKCKEGYTGPICAQCDTGFYGQPFVSGDSCKPCNCSGNVDLKMAGACDTISGRCLMCQNNTSGNSCEVCATNYFGDAVQAKNCKKCSCSSCGTIKCDNMTGICKCKQNVIGEHCDQCEANHWGFERCNGCVPCNCSKASNSTQCDLITGSCQCKPGADGQNCEKCLPGYFDLTSEGCRSCNCSKEFSYGSVCDEKGQCKCMPGVIGEKCDRCPDRWVFIPGVGCQKCENCVHGLLDFTDELRSLLNEIMSEMGDSSSSMLANRKLSRVNETVINLKVRLAGIIEKNLASSPTSDNLLMLEELKKNSNEVENMSKKLADLKQSLIYQTIQLVNETTNCSIANHRQYTMIYNLKEKLSKEINWVKSLATSLIPAKIINEESILQKGQRIMTQLKQISLEEDLNNIIKQLNESNQLNEKAVELQKPWIIFSNDLMEVKKKIDRLNNLVEDLNEKTENAAKDTVKFEQNYVSLSNSYKDIITVNKKLNDINGTIENLLIKAKEQNEKSKKILDEELSKIDIEDQHEKLSTKHEQMKEQFNSLIDNIDKLHKLVLGATFNVFQLNENATKIVNSFKDTKSYSLESVKAANSYLKIIDAIKESENSIKEVDEKIKLINDHSTNKTEETKAASLKLKMNAMQNQGKISNEIAFNLNTTTFRLNDLKHNVDKHQAAYQNIHNQLGNLQNSKLQESAQKVKILSSDAIELASSQNDNLIYKEKIIEKLDPLSQDYDKSVKNGTSILKNILNLQKSIDIALPDIFIEIDKIPLSQQKISEKQKVLDQKLGDLKRSVREARARANRIDLGLNIKPNTFVELRTPINLLKPGTYTKFSLHFKPGVENGLIAYLGNPKSIKSTASSEYQKPSLNDYLALELREKRVVLIMDVGSEPLVVFHDQKVKLNEWYFLEVEIIGKHVQLKLRSPDYTEKILNAHLEGTFTVFNLDRQNSKLYLGGIPKNIELQDKIENIDFNGEIQQVVLGDTKLGLWNFVSAKNNNEGIYKKEAAFKSPSLNENYAIKFNGKAYAQIESNYDFRRETNVFLQLKTLSEEGLIFLVGKQKYLSIELEKGKIVVRMDLESGKGVIKSKDLVNDGNWHLIVLSRTDKQMRLEIDTKEQEFKDIGGRDNFLETDGQIYFGGYPNGGHSFNEVTNLGFNGCLRELQINSKLIKLDKDDRNISPGVEFGCSENVVRELTFEKPGFITMPLKNQINQISLKFKTKEPNGLLFFASDKKISQFLSLHLKDGSLIFQSKPGQTINSNLHSERKFNDGNWHYLTATIATNIMRLDLDDKHVYQTDYNKQKTSKQHESLYLDDDLMYFGGLSSEKKDQVENLDIPINYIGCLGDVNLNEDFKNFALSKLKQNVQLVSCLKDVAENESEDVSSMEYTLTPYHSTDNEKNDFSDSKTEKIELSNENSATQTTPEINLKKNRPVRGCKLPIKPNKPETITSTGPLKYGNQRTSRTEIKLQDSKILELEKESKIEIKFKTSEKDGLILFSSDNNFVDHILVYLSEGKLYHSFNLGSGNSKMVSEKEYSDDEWHQVVIERESKNTRMTIDKDKELILGQSPGDKTSLNINSNIYIGGLPNEIIDLVSQKLKLSYSQFIGCLDDLKISFDYYLLDLENSYELVETCSSNAETKENGVFFKGEGYLKFNDEFSIGQQIKLSLEIKPRNLSGVILLAKSSNKTLDDYLLLEMVNGVLRATVNNGNGESIVAEVTDLPLFEICDGNWHNIQLIKMANVVILGFDEFSSGPKINTQNTNLDFNTDTNILYIGGFPNQLKLDYLKNKNNYEGCLKLIKQTNKSDGSDDEILDFSKNSSIIGDVNLGSCPTT